MTHVFISYVRENVRAVNRIERALTAKGVRVWLDRNDIAPGEDWQDAIRRAIASGDFFIACFSREFNSRARSYMNEELSLAIDELRCRPRNRTWFIPVLLSGEIPDIAIGGGKTLPNLQWVELSGNKWQAGLDRIIRVIRPKPIPVVKERTIHPKPGFILLPILGRIVSGNADLVSPSGKFAPTRETVSVAADLVRDPESLFALEVRGNSMIDASINDGDVVIMRHQEEAESGDLVAAWLKDERATTLKRYYPERNRVRLQPANAAFRPLFKNLRDVEIQGKVVLVIRQLERALPNKTYS